eukprot:7248379-Prymnesium_polylepis.1
MAHLPRAVGAAPSASLARAQGLGHPSRSRIARPSQLVACVPWGRAAQRAHVCEPARHHAHGHPYQERRVHAAAPHPRRWPLLNLLGAARTHPLHAAPPPP